MTKHSIPSGKPLTKNYGERCTIFSSWEKQGNVVHCGPVVFVCFENKHLAISITLMALSVTMDFAPCSNALRFTALCVYFVLFISEKKNAWKPAIC